MLITTNKFSNLFKATNTKKTIRLATALVAMISLGVLGEGEKASAAILGGGALEIGGGGGTETLAVGGGTETVGFSETETLAEGSGTETLAGGGVSETGNAGAPEPITGLIFAAGIGGAALKRAKDKSKKN